jgi:hypothetical protein
VCGICVSIEGACQGLLDLGPELDCKTVGAEVTLGVKALEDLCGIIHASTTMYPTFLPSNLFLLCCVRIPCIGGQDEKKTDDLFEEGESSPVTKVKLCRGACSANPACAPHTALSQGICGLCMDPLFNGSVPCWYCKETVFPPVFKALKDKGASGSRTEPLLEDNSA